MTSQEPVVASSELVMRNVAELAQRQQARELGSAVGRNVFRLLKVAQFHALDNMAFLQQLDQTVEALAAFGKQTGEPLALLFTKSTVFVNGQLLKATRGEYEAALELSRMVRNLGVTQLTIQNDAGRPDLKALAKLFQPGSKTKAEHGVLEPSPRVRLRYVHAAKLDENDHDLSPEDQVLRTYATTVVVMRRVYENLAAGRYQLPNQVKRLAQRLVVLSEGDTPAFLGVTGMRNLNHDDAGRAVNRAILAVSMARQLTKDLATLSRIAMAGLFFDVAMPLVTGTVGRGDEVVVAQVTDQARQRLPSATAVVLTALGQVREASLVRTVIAFEGQWLRNADALGPVYGGELRPMVAARIVATANRFNELMEPDLAASRAPSVDDAISTMRAEAKEALDQAMLVLLVGAIGVFPRGAPVELTTGEKAVVLSTPDNPAEYTRPTVRLVQDGAGNLLRAKISLDLRTDPERQVARVITDPDAVLREACLAVRPSVAPPKPPAPPPEPPSPSLELEPIEVAEPSTPSRSSATPPPPPVGPPRRPQKPSSVQPPPPSSVPLGRRSVPPPSLRSQGLVEVVDAPPSRRDPRSDDFDGDDTGARSARLVQIPPRSAPPHAQPSSPPSGTPAPPRSEPAQPGPVVVDPRQGPKRSPGERLSSDGFPPSLSWRQRAASLPPEDEDEVPRRFARTHAPSASGVLEKTPFSHLLLFIQDRNLTGTLILTAPPAEGTLRESEHAVHFESGNPRKAVIDAWVAPLGSELVAAGALEQSDLEGEGITRPPTHEATLERELLELGLVQADQLVEIRTEQLYARLGALFALPLSTRFEFFAGIDLVQPEWGLVSGKASPRAALTRGLREFAEEAAMARVLGPCIGEPLQMCEGADVYDFEFSQEEIAVVVAIANAAPSVRDLEASGHDPSVVRRVVYALMLARCAAPLG